MKSTQSGFSLLELMIAVAVLSVISAIAFRAINQAQFRVTNEQVKLDQFQESREFVDQLTRDLRQAGYPNVRMYAPGTLASPEGNQVNNAVGLVKVDTGDLWFEGDLDGDGVVESVRYHLDSTGTGCPCLRRSMQGKQLGDPVTGQGTPVYQTEVQNVQNTDIFAAVQSNGTAAALPVDFANQPTIIADVRQIRVNLQLQAPAPDMETRRRAETNLRATITLSNCSSAATGMSMSCK